MDLTLSAFLFAIFSFSFIYLAIYFKLIGKNHLNMVVFR